MIIGNCNLVWCQLWWWWRGGKCESANINRWVRVLLLIHAAQNEPNISVKHRKLAFPGSIIPTHRRMLKKLRWNVNHVCFKKFSYQNSILQVLVNLYQGDHWMRNSKRETNTACIRQWRRGGDMLSGVCWSSVRWRKNQHHPVTCHTPCLYISQDENDDGGNDILSEEVDDLGEESERKMREEEEGEVEGGVKGERRGLLSRTRENGGARKVSNPLHYCGANVFVFLLSDWQA